VIRRHDFNIAAGIIAAAAGVFYFVLSFTPDTPPLVGWLVTWKERRDYFHARTARQLSRQAEQQLNRNTQTTLLTTATLEPYGTDTVAIESHTTTPRLMERTSHVSIQLSQISLPEGATATFHPDPEAITLPEANRHYPSGYPRQKT
jgi:hypothetical protein